MTKRTAMFLALSAISMIFNACGAGEDAKCTENCSAVPGCDHTQSGERADVVEAPIAEAIEFVMPETVIKDQDSCWAYINANKLKSCIWNGEKSYTLVFENNVIAEINARSYSKNALSLGAGDSSIKFSNLVPNSYVWVNWYANLSEEKWSENPLLISNDHNSSVSRYTAYQKQTPMDALYEVPTGADAITLAHGNDKSSNVIYVKSVKIDIPCEDDEEKDYYCEADDNVIDYYSCDPVLCQAADDESYRGAACSESYHSSHIGTVPSQCSCQSLSDCRPGFECTEDGSCVPVYCTPAECRNMDAEDYKGNACIEDPDPQFGDAYGFVCGCESNDDCNNGYACDKKKSVCVKASELPACESGEYSCSADGIPRKCQNGKWVNMTGCQNGEVCVNGYCEEPKDPSLTEKDFTLIFPEIADTSKDACEAFKKVNKLTSCTWNKGLDYTLVFTTGAAANIHPKEYSQNQAGILPNYSIEFSNVPAGYQVDFDWTVNTNALMDNTNNVLLISDASGSKSKYTPYSLKMKNTFMLDDNATSFAITHSGSKNASTLYIKSISVIRGEKPFCSLEDDDDGSCEELWDDYNYCDSMRCARMDDDNYFGDMCAEGVGEDGSDGCGCNYLSDCRDGYDCSSETLRCYPSNCVPSECKAMDDDEYEGDACIVDGSDYDMSHTCGCDSDLDCRDGYECDGDKCVKTED